MKRKIIEINEKKCNGCGLCLPNCPEGAIQIIDPFSLLNREMMIEVAEEMGYENAVIQLGEKIDNIDSYIDSIVERRTKIQGKTYNKN